MVGSVDRDFVGVLDNVVRMFFFVGRVWSVVGIIFYDYLSC